MTVASRLIRHIVGAETRTPAEKVLRHCDSDDGSVDCWTQAGAGIRVALYLEHHPEENGHAPGEAAKVRVAYESYRPRPVTLKRSLEAEGAELAPYNKDAILELKPGRTGERAYRSSIMPGGVTVTKRESGGTIRSEIQFLGPDEDLGEHPLSVSFPDAGPNFCPCC